MNEPFLAFEWAVHADYQWHELRDERGHVRRVKERGGLANLGTCSSVELAYDRELNSGRATGPLLRPSGKTVIYRPMAREHAALFREFAEVDYRDVEAIRTFANKYGRLGVDSKHAPAESHLHWAREICLMREALSLSRPWTQAREAADARIWATADAAIEALWRRHGNSGSHKAHRRTEDRRKLEWLFNLHLQHVQTRLHAEEDVPVRLQLAPLSLLAAMWLQLALAVTGDKRFVACKFCSRLFEISTEPSGFRSHREFCTASCKTLDYRKRQRLALTLKADGKTPGRIAAAIGTDLATVTRWLARHKGVVKRRRKPMR